MRFNSRVFSEVVSKFIYVVSYVSLYLYMILTLGITYKGFAFPLLFSLLDKLVNSDWKEREAIMERFIHLFGKDYIDCLAADREFIGKEWIGWLNDNRIRYYICIRQNIRSIKPSTRERVRARWLFNSRKVGQENHKLFLHEGGYDLCDA